MRVGLEGFLLINGLINAVVLLIALRWAGQQVLLTWRVGAAATLGAVYAVIAYLPGLPWTRSYLISLSVCIAMLLVAVRWRRWRQLLRALLLMYTATFLAGGTAYSLSQALGGVPPVWLAGAVAALGIGLWLFRVREARRQTWRGNVEIALGEASARVEALIDSGNILREPVTGLPVVLAPFEALGGLLPTGCDPTDLTTLPPGFRLVSAATAGGAMLLMCFKPTGLRLCINGAWHSVAAMVAINPRPLPEGAVALVPAALTEAAS